MNILTAMELSQGILTGFTELLLADVRSLDQDRPKADPIPGASLPRFDSDEAIQAFCAQNYLDDPEIDPQGRIYAWSEYEDRYIQIGWIK
jgi:hypothetical protein